VTSNPAIIDKIHKLVYGPVQNHSLQNIYGNLEAAYLYDIYYDSAQKIYDLYNDLYQDVSNNNYYKEDKKSDFLNNLTRGTSIDELKKKLDENITIPDNLSELIDNIEGRDKGISTEESIHNLAIQKTILINKFLTTIKESSIDCFFNKKDNILSDPELTDINCIDKLDSTSEYIYNIGIKDKPFYNIESKDDLIEKIKKNRKKFKF
jgi:hypothetical protein